MKLKLNKQTVLKLVAMVTAGALSLSASAIQTVDKKKPVQPLPSPTEYAAGSDMEVIQVTGEYPLGWYRDQRYEKEVVFYSALNDLIKDEEFHVTCKRTFRHNNSRISKRYCQPQFFETLKQEEVRTRTSLRSFDSMIIESMSDAQYRKAVAEKREEMAKLVAEKVKANPEIAQKLQNLLQARYEYQIAHAEKFGKLSQYAVLLDNGK
jgi:hypothetical protein